MNKTIKNLMITIMLLVSTVSLAELPSWGMTESQYKLPNFSNKMSEIGAQANKNNWLLKVTAPKEWQSTIRNALTKTGEREVQMTFKDSIYQSIAISAVKGAKVAKITTSSGSTTVQKQVIMEKPEIDTEVEAPDFGDTNFQNNTNELLENIANMEISVPEPNAKPRAAKPAKQKVVIKPAPATKTAVVTEKPATVKPVTAKPVATQPAPKVVNTAGNDSGAEDIAGNKEDLRKRHARAKRVQKVLSYSNITTKDELFIKGSVVLVKRFINQGVVLYFWMKESYDPTVHKLIENGSGKYQKDPEAIAGVTPVSKETKAKVEAEEVSATNLDFTAVNTVIEDQDDLRRSHARNKRVEFSISAKKLKEDDILYVKNQTVLVERPITSSQSAYFWLVGETIISRGIEREGDNKFIIE